MYRKATVKPLGMRELNEVRSCGMCLLNALMLCQFAPVEKRMYLILVEWYMVYIKKCGRNRCPRCTIICDSHKTKYFSLPYKPFWR